MLVRTDVEPPELNSWYLVDVSGEVPGSLQPLIDDPPAGTGVDVDLQPFSPDSRHVVAYLIHEVGVDAFVVDANDGTVAAVHQVTPDIEGGIDIRYVVEFSPDSQILFYVAAVEDPDTYDLYAVDLAGAAPGPPIRINLPFDDGGRINQLATSYLPP